MGRRNDHSREELSEIAIKAGFDIAIYQGVEALTTRAVAGVIGYSVGTLYNIFNDFEDYLLHVNCKTFTKLEDYLHQRLSEKEANSYEELQIVFIEFVTFTEENKNLWQLIVQSHSAYDKPYPKWYLRRLVKLLRMLEVPFCKLFSYLSKKEAKRAARVLWIALFSTCSVIRGAKNTIVGGNDNKTINLILANTYIAGLMAMSKR